MESLASSGEEDGMSSGRCYTRRMSTSRHIPTTHTLRAVLDLSPVSGRETSRILGHSDAWARMAARPTRNPRLDTLADVAGIAGLDVALIDRRTGDVVAVVEPPTPAARHDDEERQDGERDKQPADSTPAR